jgi:aspartyl-tRNA(Asn)/glutamyl-tRNA(Gln) amidotransferase subunit C
MALTPEEVAKIAHLARIGFSEEEMNRVGKDLTGILAFVDQLQRIDTTGVQEAASPRVDANAFRADEASSCSEDVVSLISQNFPESQQGLLRAPAVFERPKK